MLYPIGAIGAINVFVRNFLRRMRRSPADWMQRSDEVILEFLENHPARELIGSPAVISANINYAQSTVRQRIRLLEKAGLLEYYDEDRGLYQLTDTGREYLIGDFDASTLPDPTDP